MSVSTASDAARSDTASHRRALALIVGAGIVSALQVGKAPLALEAIRAELGLDLGAASWVLSAFALVGAVVSLAIGAFADRLDARRTAVFGLLLQGVGSGVGATAAGLPLLLAARALEGLGFLALTVAAPMLIVAATEPRDRERAFAAWATFMPVGMTVVLLAAPVLGAFGWRGLWAGNAALLIAYAAVLAIGTRTIAGGREGATSRDIGKDLRQTLAAAGPWLLAALFAAYTAAFFALFGFLPTILSERLAVDAGTGGVLSAVAVGAGAFGCLACGRLLARGARAWRLLLIGFGVIALCGFGALALPVSGWIAYALCVLFSFVGAFIPVVIFDAAPRHAPRPELLGMTIGLATQGNCAGMVLGPAAAGAIAATVGWPWVASLVAAIVAAACIGVFALRARPAEAQR